MRILFHIPVPTSVGADRWIYEGWRDAFRDLGHEVFELTQFDDFGERVLTTRPHILITTWHFTDVVRQKEILRSVRGEGVTIFLLVDWPPPRSAEEAEVVRNGEVADVFFGEREPESMVGFERATGRTYHVIPNAANKLLHFPTTRQEKYQYDIVYLGAYLRKKKKLFREVLLPLAGKYKVGIFGPYWSVRDNLLRAIHKSFRTMGFRGGVDWINRRRVVVPREEENQLYSSARICLNFHEREPDDSQPHLIVNQRTFKIPACGGFQICDYVSSISKYFAEDEIVLADPNDPEDWFRKIDYYLTHEDARRKIQEKGTARALRDHTYHNRVEELLSLYRRHIFGSARA